MGQGPIAGADVYKVGVYLTAAQQHIQFGFHLRDTAISLATPDSVLSAVWEWVDTKFRTVVPATVRIDRIDATHLTTKNFGQMELINQMGTTAGALGNTMECALVALKTKSRQRWLNGRMYWPVMAGGYVDSGRWNYNMLPILTTVAADFADRFTGSPLTHPLKAVVVSKARPATPTRPAIEHQYTDVEVVKVSDLVSVQRRRKIGVGS